MLALGVLDEKQLSIRENQAVAARALARAPEALLKFQRL
jgi:hypothetical protein